MTDIVRHIEYLIRRHERVVLPGIGCLVAETIPSEVDEKGYKLLSPSRNLSFNPAIKTADGLLESSLSRKNNLTPDRSASEVNIFTRKIRKHLSENGFFILGTLGQFVMDKGLIRFIPSKNTSSYNPYTVYDILNGSDSETVDTPRRFMTIAMRGLKIAALLTMCVSIAAMLFMSMNVNMHSLKASLWPFDDDNRMETVEIPGDESESVFESLPDFEGELIFGAFEEKSSADLNGNLYVIIVGSFATENQANKFRSQHNIETGGVYNKDGNYRIFIYAPASRSDIEDVAASRSVRSKWPNAWIARYK